MNKRQQKKAIIKWIGRAAFRRMTKVNGYIVLKPVEYDYGYKQAPKVAV